MRSLRFQKSPLWRKKDAFFGDRFHGIRVDAMEAKPRKNIRFQTKTDTCGGGPKTPFTNKIPGDLLPENMISLHLKITCYLVLM